jgi:hypothetical protein
MALTWSRPALAADNPTLVYNAKERMKAVGWTVGQSGNGLASYSSSGDVITSGAVLATVKAWFEMSAPDDSWHMSYQSGSSSNTGRLKFTWNAAGFDGGSPSATQVGATSTAADEVLVVGAGSDAVPTYAAVMASSGGNVNLVVIADVSAPYNFAWLGNNTGATNGLDFLLYLDTLMVGSVDTLDVAPSVAYHAAQFAASGASGQLMAPGTAPFGWIGKGLGGAIVRIPAESLRDGSATAVPGGMNRSFYTGNAELFALGYGRRATEANPDGWKGTSTLFTWIGSTELTGLRLTTDPEGDQWIVGDDLGIRWDGTAMTNDPSAGATLTANYRSMYIQGDTSVVTPEPEPVALTPTGRLPKPLKTGYQRPQR